MIGSRLIIFGGEDRSRYLPNDVHILDLDTMTWVVVEATKASNLLYKQPPIYSQKCSASFSCASFSYVLIGRHLQLLDLIIQLQCMWSLYGLAAVCLKKAEDSSLGTLSLCFFIYTFGSNDEIEFTWCMCIGV